MFLPPDPDHLSRLGDEFQCLLLKQGIPSNDSNDPTLVVTDRILRKMSGVHKRKDLGYLLRGLHGERMFDHYLTNGLIGLSE
jgi:hypothetical protein